MGSKTTIKYVISWSIPMLIFVFIGFFLISCSQPPKKPISGEVQEFAGKPVDSSIQVILNEYFRLSKQYNVKYSRPISIGLKPLPEPVIGLCTFGDKEGWREIAINSDFWNTASWPQKVVLVFHEAVHCYCGRDHDYGPNKLYPDPRLEGILNMFRQWYGTEPGFMADGCPISIMYTRMVPERCIKKHYTYYIKEMFDRCEAW